MNVFYWPELGAWFGPDANGSHVKITESEARERMSSTQPTAGRVSRLADRIIWLILHNQSDKAMLIAQYLRRSHGGEYDFRLRYGQ